MKKKMDIDDDEMPAEFDFSNGIPNPWFVTMHGPKFVRVIDKDLADFFPDNVSMNAALRSVAEAASRIPARQKISAQRVTTSRIADAPRRRKKEGS
jgi:hypothetical protein